MLCLVLQILELSQLLNLNELDSLRLVYQSAQSLSRTNPDFARGSSAITPGAGIRYNSPVGPIRVDLGYNPRLTENLAVVTNTKVNGEDKLVGLETERTYMSGKNTFLGRLVLHLSIGQAY